MRILFLVDPLPNYVSDPLYIGLGRILGEEAVVDFPLKAVLHDPKAKVWYLPQVPAHTYTEEEVRDSLKARGFDLVVIASPRPESVETLRRFYSGAHFPPIVFIDSADESDMRSEIAAEFPLTVYFKRELLRPARSWQAALLGQAKQFRFNQSLRAKTFPLQISVVAEALSKPDKSTKDIDVSFFGHASHPKRSRAMALLESLGAEGFTVAGGIYGSATDKKYKLEFNPLKRLITKVFDSSTVSMEVQQRKLSPSAYYEVLKRSKMAVSVRGGGFDTFRYWEIPACETFLLSEMPDIVIPNDFEQHRHAAFFRSDMSDLKHWVRYFVKHEAERHAIARAGHEHLLKYHTCERRAEYFLDICAKTA